MGGGDLNMKKSWHPLLLKNQERVWLEEKKALEEKKKLDQLRKEKEEERQLQELQRLQEEQTGKKRTEKLEWMYATPATGNNQNSNDLEDYLLGKKRVDKMLTADENAKLGAAHKNFIAVQNANNARDIAAKIREDPLLAIKQQEQAAYQALMSNPLRLREMQERNGIKPKKDKKKEKEERKRLKHERKHRRKHHSRSVSPSAARVSHRRSPSPRHYRSSRSPDYSEHSRGRYDSDRGRNHDLRDRLPSEHRRQSSPGPSRRRDSSNTSSDHEGTGREQRQYASRARSRSRSPHTSHKRSRSRSPYLREDTSKRSRIEYHESASQFSRPADQRPDKIAQDRANRLAAMTSSATSMSVERQQRLAAMLEKEKAELEADERARSKSGGMGGFLSQEQKKVFGGTGGLEDRIRRGRGGLVIEAD